MPYLQSETGGPDGVTPTASAGESLLQRLLAATVAERASDLHLSAGHPPHFRRQGQLAADDTWPVLTAETLECLAGCLAARTRQGGPPRVGAIDGALSSEGGARFRFNVYLRGGAYSIALRRLEDRIRPLTELGLPAELYALADYSHGLVLVAGPTGSGKSTTLAALIDRVNHTRAGHVITIEDPVEYLHPSRKALVDQREVGQDTLSFNDALVASMRQDPDVILVGEIRDLDTIRTAITAAETGHLVLSTVHAGDCVGSIDRLVSVFHADEQPSIRRQLAMVLRAVVAQRLIMADGPAVARPATTNPAAADPAAAGESAAPRGRLVLASEVMKVNSPVANLISQAKDSHIYSIMETSRMDGMYTFDESLARLLREGWLSERTARGLAKNPQVMFTRAGGVSRRSPTARQGT